MSLAHLCLGTASWGQPYNGRMPPSDTELRRILNVAHAGGVRWLDTAVAYGSAEERLERTHAEKRFRIVTKVGIDQPIRWHVSATVVLTHLGPDDSVSPGFLDSEEGAAYTGASVYTITQARSVLDSAQVLQAPWNILNVFMESGWCEIRDRAYALGVLFFGRQPFARGLLAQDECLAREAFEWALRSNPRGWCVVGVETVAQLEQLLTWREALR